MATAIIPRSPGIYKITCVANNRIYIGSTKNLKRRWYLHLWALRSNRHDNQHLQRAFNKHGEEAFAFEVMELVEPNLLIEREQYWLDTLKPYISEMGFNIAVRANSGMAGRETSQETRQKLSSANSGKSRSEETRNKISMGLKGREFSPEHCRNLSISLKGKIPTNETRKKLSESKRGRKQDPVHVEARAQTRRKTYVVTDPSGTETTIVGLTKFCREHGLTLASMVFVSQGKRKHHKGWKCRPSK